MLIKKGDFVDFGIYGRLYVCAETEDMYWVIDNEQERMNASATGWFIPKRYAKRVIETIDIVMEDYTEQKVEITEKVNYLKDKFGEAEIAKQLFWELFDVLPIEFKKLAIEIAQRKLNDK